MHKLNDVRAISPSYITFIDFFGSLRKKKYDLNICLLKTVLDSYIISRGVKYNRSISTEGKSFFGDFLAIRMDRSIKGGGGCKYTFKSINVDK